MSGKTKRKWVSVLVISGIGFIALFLLGKEYRHKKWRDARRQDSFYLHRFYEYLDAISDKYTLLSPQRPAPGEVGIFDYNELHKLNPYLEREKNWKGVFAVPTGKQSKTERLMKELSNTSDTISRVLILPDNAPTGSQDCVMEFARDGTLLYYYNYVLLNIKIYYTQYATDAISDTYKHINPDNPRLLSREEAEVWAWKIMGAIYGPSYRYTLEISKWWEEQPEGYQGAFKLGMYKFVKDHCAEGPDAVWIDISAYGAIQEIAIVPKSYMVEDDQLSLKTMLKRWVRLGPEP